MISRWVRKSRGGFRCRYKCCHIGGRRGLSAAKRGNARVNRRAVRQALDEAATKVLDESVELDHESSKLLRENLWDLYGE